MYYVSTFSGSMVSTITVSYILDFLNKVFYLFFIICICTIIDFICMYYLRGCLKCCLGVVGNGVPDPGVGNMNGAEEVGGRSLAPIVNLPQE